MTIPSAALVMAHPGHELRVHHWIERTKPTVFILTDGSGHTGVSRLHVTTRILEQTGGVAGAIYGAYPDRALYAALLAGNVELFCSLADKLAGAFLALDVATVACDAIEGYNPVHDVCRLVTAAAVRRATDLSGRDITAFDFLLVGPPDTSQASPGGPAVRLTLDDAALDRKIAAALTYTEIAGDVHTALREHGRDAFRTECLRPMRLDAAELPAPGDIPFYERYGERQVAAGHYDRVLRYRQHVQPVAEALDAAPARLLL